MNRVNSEIGGEFWEVELSGTPTLKVNENLRFLLTGRTALDYIIKDIKAENRFNRVMLPTYCCHTMIKPFLDNGINVKFYEIVFNNGKYEHAINFDSTVECDAILIMQYFGFIDKEVKETIRKVKEKGCIVIEDATHSWFSEKPYSNESDYVFASFRKWTGLACGAIAKKQSGDFISGNPQKINQKYIDLRKQAALLKGKYISNKEGNKEDFLSLFCEAESIIEADYKEYGIPDVFTNLITHLDINTIKNTRRTNAKYLIEGLSAYNGIEISNITAEDTPLFVPVLSKAGKRDALKQHLIRNNIYCPVHWPLSKDHHIEIESLYDESISLVCDQRYNTMDMQRIIDCIGDFYN